MAMQSTDDTYRWTFDTPQPTTLLVDAKTTDVTLVATDTATTLVEIETDTVDRFEVVQEGSTIRVTEHGRGRTGGLFGGLRWETATIRVTLPTASRAAVASQSGDLVLEGTMGEVQLKTGSGDIRVATADQVTTATGSGDVTLGTVRGSWDHRCGSGDARAETVDGAVTVSTGSGDLVLGAVGGELQLKTGSGDVRLGRLRGGLVRGRSGSGDITVDHVATGRVELASGSGDLRVGVAAGVPVWTDVVARGGNVHSSLRGAGQPAPGQDHLALLLRTNGDITLEEC